MDYLGNRKITLSPKEMADFYSGLTLGDYNFFENEYVLIEDAEKINQLDPKEVKEGAAIVDEYVYRDGKLNKLNYSSIKNNFSGVIRPLNPHQECAFDLLQNQNMTVKLFTGVQGSGKTFLMTLTAIDYLQKGIFNKIVWVRNNIEVKDSVPIGALPGNVLEKLLPWAMPLADHVGGVDNLQTMINNGQVEIEHIGFMRGRDIKKSIIMSSECENLTKEQVRMLIGRCGKGSNLWMDGDSQQADKSTFTTNSGLKASIERLSGQKLFGHIYLPKTERSETAALADLLI